MFQSIVHVWNRITEPPSAIPGPGLRRRSKLLLSILAGIWILWVLALLSLPIQLALPLSEEQKKGAMTVYPLFLFLVAVPLALSHLLAHKGRYATAARIIVTTSSAVSFAEIVVTGDSRLTGLPIVAVVLCSILLPPLDTIACYLITIVLFVVIPLLSSLLTFSDMIGVTIVTTAVGCVSLLAATIHRHDLMQIEAQAEEISRNQEHLIDSRKLAAVARLSSGVAHEFNNILMAISGYAEVITKKAGGAIADYAGQILVASKRASRLTEGMLSFSQQQLLKPATVDIDDYIKKHRQRLQSCLRPGTAVSIESSPEQKILNIDTDLFCEALRSFARRAEENLPTDGIVTIRTRSVWLQHEDEHYLPAGRYCEITISNSGPVTAGGVGREMFEPFFTNGELGSGDLELAAAYGVVRQSGGQAEVKSDPKLGTVFIIMVPMALPAV